MPRWQELPQEAVIGPHNAWRLRCWGRQFSLPVLVLSYPWLDAVHPDREGEQLRRALAKRACLRVSLFQTNWFSADTPNSYYREYLELDRDENGMISKQELALFRRQ